MLVAEGVGGLLVPLADDYSVCDLAVELGLGLLVAARPGLGTINHTLLTLRAAARPGWTCARSCSRPWPSEPGEIERSNRATIERLGDVEVGGAADACPAGRAGTLARAGATLPGARWLGAHA